MWYRAIGGFSLEARVVYKLYFPTKEIFVWKFHLTLDLVKTYLKVQLVYKVYQYIYLKLKNKQNTGICCLKKKVA